MGFCTLKPKFYLALTYANFTPILTCSVAAGTYVYTGSYRCHLETKFAPFLIYTLFNYFDFDTCTWQVQVFLAVGGSWHLNASFFRNFLKNEATMKLVEVGDWSFIGIFGLFYLVFTCGAMPRYTNLEIYRCLRREFLTHFLSFKVWFCFRPFSWIFSRFLAWMNIHPTLATKLQQLFSFFSLVTVNLTKGGSIQVFRWYVSCWGWFEVWKSHLRALFQASQISCAVELHVWCSL